MPANKFRRTLEALNILRSDSGCVAEPGVMLRWAPRLPEIERALCKLSRNTCRDISSETFGFSELETFVIGEESDQRALMRRHPSLRTAHKFLNAVFEGERP